MGSDDHANHFVTWPTIVDATDASEEWYDSETVFDLHDDASLLVERDGYVHVFVSGRRRSVPADSTGVANRGVATRSK